MSAFANHSKAMHMLFKHPLARSVAITTTGFGVSDVVCQLIEHRYSKTAVTKSHFQWNRIRTAKFSTIGFLFSPQFHYWIPFVVSLVPGRRSPVQALKRVCIDQAIFGTWATTFAISMTAVLDGKGIEGIKSNLRNQWWSIYQKNCCIFPPGQFINYLLIPVQYRVLWLNGIGFIWRVMLSYLVMGKGHENAVQVQKQKSREFVNSIPPRR